MRGSGIPDALSMRIQRHISQLGGFAATHELYALGWTRTSLRIAVAMGEAIRVRQGWYCTPDADPDDVAAFRVGGRLGCVSAAAAHGLWVKRTPKLHVEVEVNSCRHRSPFDRHTRLRESNGLVTLHWHDTGSDRPSARASVLECLRSMAFCQSPELVVAAADSALRFGRISLAQWTALTSELPRRLRRLLDRVDARSESITESLTRFRLLGLGIDTRPQVRIAGVGRVDLLIGSRLVIEVDGWQYHSDPERFEADRRRDARLSARGYRVLRFSYRQVMGSWSEVKAAILGAIARGDHLPPR